MNSGLLLALLLPLHGSRDLAFELDGGRIYLPVTVNGKKTEFLLDTGANPNVIDLSLAQRFGIGIGKISETSGVGSGTDRLAPVTSGEVKVTGIRQGFPIDVALDLSNSVHYESHFMWGILGIAFFKDQVVQIDYQSRRLHLYPAGSYHPSGRATSIPLKVENGRLLINLKLELSDGREIPARCQIDTGALGTLLLSTPFGASNDLGEVSPQYTLKRVANGVGGGSPGFVCKIDAIKISKWSFANPTIRVSTATSGMLSAKSETDGLIGYELLRRFRMTIDLPGKKLYLEPSGAFGERLPVENCGILPRGEGPTGRDYVVEEVVGGSPAARAGVKVNDKIVALDSTKAASLGYHDLYRRLGGSAKPLRLTLLRSGRLITVVINRHPLI